MSIGDKRRALILSKLSDSQTAISASALAKNCDVSRQIIVGDIALLRASGHDIIATPRGYILNKNVCKTYKIAVHHTPEQTRIELETLVALGIEVIDVIVEHPYYGEITGSLNIRTADDIEYFLSQSDIPLLSLTKGTHIHTLICHDDAQYQQATEALQKLGILYHND